MKDFILFLVSERILPLNVKVQTAKLIAVCLPEYYDFSCVICLVVQSK